MTIASGLSRRCVFTAASLAVTLAALVQPAQAATPLSMTPAEAAEQGQVGVSRLTSGTLISTGRREGTTVAARAAASCAGVRGPVPSSQTAVASGGIRVNHCVVPAVNAMVAAAAKSGVALRGWGWRDTNRQIELRKQNCGTSYYAVYQMPSSRCSPPTAIPGRSMHERGLAIDFYVAGSARSISGSSKEFRWLKANAKSFGFYNLPSESWHWSTNGA